MLDTQSNHTSGAKGSRFSFNQLRMRKESCYHHDWVALLLLVTAWSAHLFSKRDDEWQQDPKVILPQTVKTLSSFVIILLQCSAVLANVITSPACPGDKCASATNPAGQFSGKTAASNSSSGEELSSAGISQGLGNIIATMDDGIRIMNSKGAGGTGDNTFVLGMTGAGKSTVTLLLTAFSSLYSCKKETTDLNYVIRDDKQVISTVDSFSKTKIPEIIHVPHLGTTIYDCPGFSDTNSTDELTNAYFIKHALDGSKKAKFLLVAPIGAFQTAGNRQYFSSLLLHTVRTVKDVEKYKDSFALAVTFADPAYSNDAIVKSVSGFMKSFKDKELAGKFEGEEAGILSSARALIESLRAQEGGKFVAIGAFRTPTQHGPLRDILAVREDREGLLHVLSNGTYYTPTKPQDFGFSVSDGGILRAVELGRLIDQTISQNMHQFWADLQRRYERELFGLRDPTQHRSIIEGTLDVLRSVRPFFNSRHGGNSTWAEGPKEFVVNLMRSMASLKLDLPGNPILSSILLQDSHAKFVASLLAESDGGGAAVAAKPLSSDWLKGLEPLVELFNLYKRWTMTLIGLEESLATHQIQKLGYTFPEFRNQSGLIDVTARNIQVFNLSQAVPQELGRIKADLIPFADQPSINFRQLNPILEYFSSRVTCMSNGTVVTVAGNFILASKLVRNEDSCVTAVTRKVVIRAWDSFFLDAVINAKMITGKDTFDLVIIANRLTSYGNGIVLTGRDAESHKEAVAAAKGAHGADGLAGMRGGDFAGIFGQILSGEVSVDSNGGRGGKGQAGQTGTDGRNGLVFDYKALDRIKMTTTGTWLDNYPSGCLVDSLSLPGGLKYEVQYGLDKRCLARLTLSQSSYEYYFSGPAGNKGGPGGNGGAAGQAGQRGVGRIYETLGLYLRANDTSGSCGPAGLSGEAGMGGKGGLSTTATSCVNNDKEVNFKCTFNLQSINEQRASNGNTGEKGADPRSCQQRTFSPHAYTPDIIAFKAAARTQLTSPSAHRRLLPFLLTLERNRGVASEFFTAESFVTDLVALENQLPSLLGQSDVELNLLYDAVLNRTAEMLARSPSELNRAILRHAASAVYGRLAMLNKRSMNAQSNLITDLEGYIDLTNQVLKRLAKTQSNSNAAAQLTATKEKFFEFIQSRIKEVDDLTEQVIQPEISKIQVSLNKGMERILQHLIEERQTAATTRNDLYTKQFENTQILSKIFGFVKIAAGALSFLGPKGAAAGAIVTTVASITESFVVSKPRPTSAPLASAVQDKALSWHLESQKQKLADKESQLRDIKKEFESSFGAGNSSMLTRNFQTSKEQVGSALNRVDELTNGVKRVQSLDSAGDDGAYEAVESLEEKATLISTEVENALEAVEKSLVEESEENKEEAGKLLDTTRTMLSIVKTAADVYKLFRQDDSKVAELAKAEKVLQGYDSKIKSVDSRMPQILSKLKEITAGAFKSARNQSSSGAALDISGWQLESTLDDVSLEIENQILVDPSIDGPVKASMRKLQEAFRTVFKICDRIQDYVTEQRMATFISDSLLSTVEAISPQDNPELHRNLQKLKLISQSNLVLHNWQNIENSFRMFVFPYADIYVSQISLLHGEQDLLLLPHNLTDLPTLVKEISRRTGELKRKLATFRTTIVPELHTNARVGGFNLGNPFYTWTGEDVKALLPDLLTGRPVNLIADIRDSPVSFDAVKFNGIHLHLIHHENDAVNSTLQSALRSFGLNMTHGGVNPYRFDGKHHGVYSEPLSLQVSYESGPNQHKNQNYVKLGQGPPLLSPYTLWTFQLYRNLDGVTFEKLRRFLGQELSLVLTGYGTYVTNSAGQSAARQVDRFYKAVQM